ncbi:alpha/beta fold hydrolase [Microbacterium kyungheense]|uniref:Pimeloyl-ACP methyl ester carboxylesterase n=1 Tax=Microbacterium kyungheense TaxID=1263636 RepID=A0A543ES01_9MICO|nr:alpha/beta fold hydrolase [Microbacterium kyungheense]TQM24350.1 pimeloyl-ACP methyl ester carboxylesterase [Microbacterium kyungheense]
MVARANRAAVPDEGMARAAALDAAVVPIDWSVLPEDAVRDAVDAPSGRLARVTMGPADGPRVVLVPGMTGSKEDFTLMMPLFAAAGFRVESFDLAGQFESAGAGPENLDPPQRRYTRELFVDDLLAVLATGAVPAHVLGYSFAGTVAAVAASLHPELFASLTLLSAPPLTGRALRGFKVMGPFSYVVPARWIGPLFIAALRHNVHRAPRERAVFVTARFELTRASSVADIMALMQRTPEVSRGLRAAGIPILVVTGTGDVWRTSAHRAFAERLGARVLVLPTGHSPCETAPHQLTEAMRELMRG